MRETSRSSILFFRSSSKKTLEQTQSPSTSLVSAKKHPPTLLPPCKALKDYSVEVLKKEQGEAKKDIKLGHLTLRKMSVEYKLILETLDNYHKTSDLQSLDKLRQAVNAYKGKRNLDSLKEFVNKAFNERLQEQYKELGIAINENTKVVDFTQANAGKDMQCLGKGKFNSVYSIQYTVNRVSKGMVFKPLKKKDGGWVARQIGIDTRDAQMGLRNIATYKLAQKLKFDVIPRSEMGVNHEGKLGLVMEKAEGKNAYDVMDPAVESKTETALRNDPVLRRELVKLQLIDALTGQGDRHGGNYFIQFQNGKCIGVKGIDNDQALGLNTQHPHQTLFVNDEDIEAIPQSKHGYISDKDLSERRAHHGYRGVWLPPVMDTEMVAAFKTMTENDIKEAMQGLSDAEITATIKRLEAIKDHIVVLEKRTAALAKEKKPGPIIAPEQWGSTEVTEWMFPSTNATAKFMEMSTNYLDREIKDSMRLKNKI